MTANYTDQGCRSLPTEDEIWGPNGLARQERGKRKPVSEPRRAPVEVTRVEHVGCIDGRTR